VKRYTVQFSASAWRKLASLSEDVQRRILDAVSALEDAPRSPTPGAKRLTAKEALWRLRVGSYRIVYSIHDDVLVILVVNVGDRKDVYR
jgi:mRNA interferase RelE/StbE